MYDALITVVAPALEAGVASRAIDGASLGHANYQTAGMCDVTKRDVGVPAWVHTPPQRDHGPSREKIGPGTYQFS